MNQSSPLSPLDLLVAPQAALVGVFALGATAGICLTLWTTHSDRPEMRRTIALLITLLWMLSVLAGMLVVEYRTSAFVHGMMGAVAAYLFKDEAGEISLPFSIRPR